MERISSLLPPPMTVSFPSPSLKRIGANAGPVTPGRPNPWPERMSFPPEPNRGMTDGWPWMSTSASGLAPSSKPLRLMWLMTSSPPPPNCVRLPATIMSLPAEPKTVTDVVPPKVSISISSELLFGSSVNPGPSGPPASVTITWPNAEGSPPTFTWSIALASPSGPTVPHAALFTVRLLPSRPIVTTNAPGPETVTVAT